MADSFSEQLSICLPPITVSVKVIGFQHRCLVQMAAPIWKLQEIVAEREAIVKALPPGRKGAVAAATRLEKAKDNLDRREKELAAEAAAETAMKGTPLTTTTSPLTQSKLNGNPLPSSNPAAPLQSKLTTTPLPNSESSLTFQSNFSSGNLDHGKSHTTVTSKCHGAENPPPAQGNKKGPEAIEYNS